ncbi:MAG: Aldose 1-epimerase [uncultured Sulfurovum sp.]|uniref:Putative glucose-6-phosphate 1-epimerase n=1 Tax=uncultured Sulfurovum sp. TaxID=269237 RepID=A0A6S6TQW3_9BACT|nr:MAG: Aldose 1-epimerase [uncultured Sulfurovum sp.]
MTIQKELDNEFKYLEVNNAHAQAKIALQGAHIFHYKAHDKPQLLWLSEKAYFENGKAIRGGVPISFPWFGPHKYDTTLPQHGFARNQMWKLMLNQELADGSTHLQFLLTPNEATKALWNYNFLLIYNITIGKELTMELTTLNCDNEAFEITQALHSYFNVSHISNVSIEGLDKCIYYNSLDKGLEKQHGTMHIEEEVDRVYFDANSKITLLDQEQELVLDQEGSNSLVVWNPWKEKSKTMTDMQDNGYQSMICLETANALKDFVLVAPNKSHTLKVSIK